MNRSFNHRRSAGEPASFHRPTFVAALAVIMTAATASAQDNPFETPAERATRKAGAKPATSANPFETPAERAAHGAPKIPIRVNPFETSTEHSARTALLNSSTPRLIDQEPFDVVVLNEKPPKPIEVRPLDFPGRTPPAAPKPDDLLRVRLRNDASQEYFVRWGDVVEVRMFETQVLAEAQTEIRDGRYDSAFEIISELRRRFPNTPELNTTERDLLIGEARRELSQGRLENVVALSERLHSLNPNDAEFTKIYGEAMEGRIIAWLNQKRLADARRLIDQLAARLPKFPTKNKIDGSVAAALAAALQTADRDAAAGRFGSAQITLRDALALAPDAGDIRALYDRLRKKNPAHFIGVVEPFVAGGAKRTSPLTSWPARRVDALLRPQAFEIAIDPQTRRVDYRAAEFRWKPDPADFKQGRLEIADAASRTTPSDIVAALMESSLDSSPLYRPDLALRRVEFEHVGGIGVDMRWRQMHPRPESLFASVFADRWARADRWSSVSEDSETRFIAPPTKQGEDRPPEIIERTYPSEEAAIDALLSGEVDLVDRIAPWQMATLQSRRDVQLVRYAAPSTHLLVFRPKQSIMRRPEFRRGLCYAIDRAAILHNHLQPADEGQGTQLARGIFSSGRTPDDPLGYAGNPPIEPREFELQSAFVMAGLATQFVAGSAENQAAGASPSGPARSNSSTAISLKLAHPPTMTAERACRQIAAYWRRIGVETTLTTDATDDVDVVYLTLVSYEPIVDVYPLFGDDGPFYFDVASYLDRLATVEYFAQAREILHDLQRSIHADALALPLWQLNEYAARSRRMTLGDAASPMSLYDHVDRWTASDLGHETRP